MAGCEPSRLGHRVAALEDSAWKESGWISAKDAPVFDEEVKEGSRAADGTSWFVRITANAREVRRATWMTTALGVYELYVNGKVIGNDFLKPGFTHPYKTRRSFTYDVTDAMRRGAGEANILAAEVSAGWWRDKIVSPRERRGFVGRKSAFRGVLEVEYADGTMERFGTNCRDWKAGTRGPVTHAAIFDGESFDARQQPGFVAPATLGEAEPNDEFKGEILPSEGAEVTLRGDLALKPVRTYVWQGVKGANQHAFGTVMIRREYEPDEEITLAKGETLVVDFGQNAAAVPAFAFKAAEGTVLTALPAEMLNDENGLKKRGNDGPEGSVYRVNLRTGHENGRRLDYTFAKSDDYVIYCPRFTFFGYRYLSVAATGEVTIKAMRSVPVTSITPEMEIGTLETGSDDINRLVSNVRWGQLSNYLSIPTDCPQRNERLGWTADTQVFAEAGSFNANTLTFFHKWMRDLRDSQDEVHGGFPGVAPLGQYGGEKMRLGWADAGVIVPYQMWKQFGDTRILDENWAAMERYMARVNETKFAHGPIAKECRNYQWADWLSYEKLESCGGGIYEKDADGKRVVRADALLYWDYLGACYWLWDAQMMETMARATGRDAAKYAAMQAEARQYLKTRFFAAADGMIVETFRDMQTPALFALKLGLVEGESKAKTIAALRQNFVDHGGCLQTGFLGTSILMDTLTENGMVDIAYDLLFQRKNPSWLYSVDQGATTIWERWNSYRKDTGFGPVGMNSFNHYAYGAVLAWIYKTAAGIAADPQAPGFKRIVMKPVPDRRLGSVTAEYNSAAGLVKSAWRYEGDEWVWEFSVPEGAVASVTVPGDAEAKEYGPGNHRIVIGVK